jgi:hypothetical protein
MEYVTRDGIRLAIADRDLRLGSVRDILDLIFSASYLEACVGVVLFKESLPAQFFDLKTGFAGEVTQKFSNYRFKLAIVGDFSQYSSSLRDFIYESNKGNLVFFKSDTDSALSSLSAANI